jgi:hypothetical protein
LSTQSFFSEEIAQKIVQCIFDAISDDIQADIRMNDLFTTVSSPSRIWDYLNRNINRALGAENCIVAKAHRGFWQMVVACDLSTRNVITFMREKRLAELQRSYQRRSRMHYIDMLTRQFNSDLPLDNEQTSLFPKSFSDEDQLNELVQLLLSNLTDSVDVIQHHILVLFETTGFQLTNVRAVMVTPSLEIARNCEQDLSMYIPASSSAVVEKVDNPESAANQPGRRLNLKAKALERKKNKPRPKANESDWKVRS